MHDHHKHHSHGHSHEHEHAGAATLRTLYIMLEHWIEHGDSHNETYQEWAAKAHEVGEEEISREIYLAINDSKSVNNHLKRAKAILAAKLVLME